MTIGPAPMIRIEAMSVRLGIEAREGAQKKGALLRVLRSRADRGKSGARALFRPESPGREGALSPMWAAPALGHARSWSCQLGAKGHAGRVVFHVARQAFGGESRRREGSREFGLGVLGDAE